MTNIHQLQIPVILVITDQDYYPLPAQTEAQDDFPIYTDGYEIEVEHGEFRVAV